MNDDQGYIYNIEYEYLRLLEEVLYDGEVKTDRTGVGTKSIFGFQMRHDLSEGFPLLTTKAVNFEAVASELLWFIEGSSDERRLAEIRHGTRDPSKSTIWTGNATAPYWKDKARFEGDLGRVYGVQWRDWQTYKASRAGAFFEEDTPVDQLGEVENLVRNHPESRRMILTAWNPGELDQMALPPCHLMSQWHVNQEKNTVNCQVYIRSNDLFLGAPFNIASYALFIHMMAQATGRLPGQLVYTIGDAHIYLNHIDQVKEQLARNQRPLPQLEFTRSHNSIFDFGMDSFRVIGYDPHPSIKASMAV